MRRGGSFPNRTRSEATRSVLLGSVFLLVLTFFALLGYSFAYYFLAFAAAISVGAGSWYAVRRATLLRPLTRLVALGHVTVLVGIPAVALVFSLKPPNSTGDGSAFTMWSVPYAVWQGTLMSLLLAVWERLLGRRIRGRTWWDGG